MATVETLKAIADAFNRHDLDAIMEFFADDAVFESPRGPDPWGRRFEGKAAISKFIVDIMQEYPRCPLR